MAIGGDTAGMLLETRKALEGALEGALGDDPMVAHFMEKMEKAVKVSPVPPSVPPGTLH